MVIGHVGNRTAAASSDSRQVAADHEARALETIVGTPGVRAVTVDRLQYVTARVAGGASRVTTVSTLAADEALRWQRVTQGRVPGGAGRGVPAGRRGGGVGRVRAGQGPLGRLQV